MESLDLNTSMDAICRTCLKSHRNFTNIFKPTKNDTSIMEMLIDCIAIKVEINDGLPENICSTCYRKLSSACSFKAMAIDCDVRLNNFHRSTVTKLDEGNNKIEVSYNDQNLSISNKDIKPDEDLDVIKESDCKNAIETSKTDTNSQLFNNLQDRSSNTSDCENEKPDVSLSSTSDEEEVDFGDDTSDDTDEEAPQESALHKSNRQRTKRGMIKAEPDRKTLLCKYCNKLFSLRYYFDIHIHQHTGNTPHKCDLCDKRFVKRSMLNKHKQIHSDTKPHQCNLCGKKFKYLSNVQNHKVIHSEQKPYKCDVCNKGFKVPGGLKIHKRRHTGERPYICEMCGKSFISQGDLALHFGTHNPTKNFSCPKCGKSFANKMSLKVHSKRHSNYKPYPCDRCNKSFATNAILQHHILIHTGEKPYTCNLCGKAFRQSACIPRHMRIHTGETPYPCEQCPSKFKYKHHLMNHMKTHG